MNILQVNNCDLPGRIFNGFDLNVALRERAINANQIVMDKYSDSEYVTVLNHDILQREAIIYEEEKHCIKNLLFPYANVLEQNKLYKKADVVHFHFPYHNMFSLMDYQKIMDSRAVWTIHNFWPITGNCTYPMECKKWQDGCHNCDRYNDDYFPMAVDNTEFMWRVKKESYKNINPHIVVSTKYVEDYIRKSPLTEHFTNVHRIPFGIKLIEKAKPNNQKVVLAFRLEDAKVKGCDCLFEALRELQGYEDKLEIQCVGGGTIPDDISNRFNIKNLGWINDREEMLKIMYAWDIFVMPSLAESFGLMAIESMGCKCALICFANTVVEEISNAPKCAIASKYKDAKDLYLNIKRLIDNRGEREHLQNEGFKFVKENYSFDLYVDRHIALYEEVMKGNL